MRLIKHERPGLLAGFPDELMHMFSGRPMRWLMDNGEESTGLGWAPSVDIKEEEDRFLVRADVPGVDPKDIEVTLDRGILTIRGERKEEKKDEGEGYRCMERFSGSFFRRFTLPDTANPEKVSAHTDKGVLEVMIPKMAERKAKRIKVD
jgi:HSP20 family protein